MSPREQPRLVAEQPAREKKSDATRARILDAAYSVLAEKGYATTSMADIARAANTQAGAMYYYFKSKDALVEALMFRESDRAQAMTLARLAALPAGMGHQERFMNLVQAGLSYSLGRESDEIVTFMRMLSQVPYPIRDRVVGKSNYEQQPRQERHPGGAGGRGVSFRLQSLNRCIPAHGQHALAGLLAAHVVGTFDRRTDARGLPGVSCGH
jgi:AcrR family transcriptional regulator